MQGNDAARPPDGRLGEERRERSVAFGLNRKNWDERAALHGQDDYYDIAGFLRGGTTLREAELELVGDIRGLDVLHLQCHIGLDTLSWARLGARATGVDFSEVAIRRARDLSVQAGIEATFVTADVLDLPAELHGRFDLVTATYGVFTWIDDLDRWAASAASALRDQGRLLVVDIHPLAQMIDQREPLVVDMPYANDGPHVFRTASSYANPSITLHHQETVQWAHSVGEIVSAIARARLRIEELREYLTTDKDDRPGVLTRGGDGRWRLRLWQHDLPVLVGVLATKDAAAGSRNRT